MTTDGLHSLHWFKTSVFSSMLNRFADLPSCAYDRTLMHIFSGNKRPVPTGVNMQTNIQETLWSTYGPLMDAKAICKVLYYPSVAALQAAKARGQLPFRPVEIKGRRGLFAMTDEVAELLTQAAHARPGREVEPDELPQKTAARGPHVVATAP